MYFILERKGYKNPIIYVIMVFKDKNTWEFGMSKTKASKKAEEY